MAATAVTCDYYKAQTDTIDGLDPRNQRFLTVAALDNKKGIVGVAPGAKTWNLKVLDDNGETEMSNVIAALDRVLEIQAEHPGIPAVVNISFGADVGTTSYTTLDEAIDSVVEQGVVVVVSAGNEGIDASTVTPAHAKGAITVGAYDLYDRFADFSNYGSTVDILAPGVDILALGAKASRDNKYGVLMKGTSMTALHVSGAALLYLSGNPKATPEEVKKALLVSAKATTWNVPKETTASSVWVGDF